MERILEAAREELAERPADEIRADAIAERAGVPVGSLYQYFDGKNALLAAVAEIVMAEADAALARVLANSLETPWREAVDRLLDATFDHYRDSPHYRSLLRSLRSTPEFASVAEASNRRVEELIALHPGFARAGIDRDQVRVICRTLVTASNALQDRILGEPRDEFELWREETRRLVKGYLATYLA